MSAWTRIATEKVQENSKASDHRGWVLAVINTDVMKTADGWILRTTHTRTGQGGAHVVQTPIHDPQHKMKFRAVKPERTSSAPKNRK